MSGMQTASSAYSDRDLVSLAKDGKEEALSLLIQRYAPFIKGRAYCFAKGILDVDDLCQEGMIALLSAVRGFSEDQSGSFRTFAAVCVNNKLRSAVTAHMREKNTPMRTYLSLSDDEDMLLASTEDPAQRIIADEEFDARRRKIATVLSLFERQVLALYLRAFSYEEMAELLDCGFKAVDNALQRIRRKLRGVFTED